MAISASARQRVLSGLWGSQKAGSFGSKASTVAIAKPPFVGFLANAGRLLGKG